jgi:hypothetical protein
MARRLDRRELLGLLGGVVALGACTDDAPAPRVPERPAGPGGFAPAPPDAARLSARSFESAGRCERTPEQAEGPFHVGSATRGDIREDRPGTRTRLGVRVVDAASCAPLPGAVVEVWHCDAAGDYSGFEDAGRDTRFLRGAQPADGDGIAEITTVFPGWYSGRAPHVHAKVRTGEREVLTTQLYFDDAVSAAVYENEPYVRRGGRWVRNADDGIYVPDTVMTVSRDGDGLLALLTVGVVRG